MKSADLLLEGAARAEAGPPGWAELRRRLGFEMNGNLASEQRHKDSKTGRFTAHF